MINKFLWRVIFYYSIIVIFYLFYGILLNLLHIPTFIIKNNTVAYLTLFFLILLLNKYLVKQKVFFKSNVSFYKQWIIDTFIICYMSLILNNFSLANFNILNKNTFDNLSRIIVGGVIEEYVFRGVILLLLLNYFIYIKVKINLKTKNWRSVILAVLISSFMFSIIHFLNVDEQSFHSTIIQVINAFSLGIVFSVIYLRTRSILWSMLMHASYDLSSYFLLNNYFTSPTLTQVILQVISSITMMLIFLRMSKVKEILNYFF